jgi:hypothetical protein
MQDKSKAILTVQGLKFTNSAGNSLQLDEVIIDGLADLNMEPGELESTNNAAITVVEKIGTFWIEGMKMFEQMDRNKRQESEASKLTRENLQRDHEINLQTMRQRHDEAMTKLRQDLTNANIKARATNP